MVSTISVSLWFCSLGFGVSQCQVLLDAVLVQMLIIRFCTEVFMQRLPLDGFRARQVRQLRCYQIY